MSDYTTVNKQIRLSWSPLGIHLFGYLENTSDPLCCHVYTWGETETKSVWLDRMIEKCRQLENCCSGLKNWVKWSESVASKDTKNGWKGARIKNTHNMFQDNSLKHDFSKINRTRNKIFQRVGVSYCEKYRYLCCKLPSLAQRLILFSYRNSWKMSLKSPWILKILNNFK